LPSRFYVVVLGDPPQREGAQSNAEDRAVPLVDAFELFQANGDPGRREAFKCAGPGVPVENHAGGGVDGGGDLKGGHGGERLGKGGG
jgi:hypothetical protein